MSFCGKCGSSLEPGAHFCGTCGSQLAPVQSNGSGTAVQVAVAEPEPTPSSVPFEHYPVATSTPGSGVKPFFIVVATVILLGAAVAYMLLRPSRPKGPAPIIDGLAVSSANVSTYGLEKYPGARSVPVYGGSAEPVVASFESNDSPSQVMGYYRVRFPVSEVSYDPTGATLYADMNNQRVVVHAEPLVHGSRVRITITP